MSMLFYASTGLTEEISSSKYPCVLPPSILEPRSGALTRFPPRLYKEYKKRVGMFWPPITFLKGAWLLVSGQMSKVNDNVFGAAKNAPASKKDKAL